MKEVGIHSQMYCIANSLDSDKEKEIRKAMHYTAIYHDHFKMIVQLSFIVEESKSGRN